MKRIIFSIALLFVVVATKAQTINWQTYSINVSSGSFTETITAKSYTFNSDFLYVDLRLDVDGHTIHYDVTAKNIPYDPGDMKGEFQSNIEADSYPSQIFVKKRVLWNLIPASYDPDWEIEAFPTSSTYSYSGSTDIGSEEALMIYQGALFWNDSGYAEGVSLTLGATIIP